MGFNSALKGLIAASRWLFQLNMKYTILLYVQIYEVLKTGVLYLEPVECNINPYPANVEKIVS